jgi:TRAP-type C4-dicarboxylate transport system substrate-binding protein
MEDMVRAVGAIPVRMAFEEVYTGLQTGVIQGAENNFPSWVTKGHYEVARYYTVDAHVRAPEVILFSRKTWDSLTPEDRRLITRAARESIPYQRRLWARKVEDSIAKAREAECEIITEIDREPFVEAMEEVYEKHAGELSDYIERIRAVEVE